MALQTDGYNADTEGSINSPLQDDSDDGMEEKDPESEFTRPAGRLVMPATSGAAEG